MDKEKVVSQYFHEGTVAMMERTIRRLWITVILLIVLLVGTNGAWLYFESQWEYYETTEIDQDGEGVNIVGGGDVSYGTDGNDN
jgi:hypothetical protein